jgi:hypothetical protein
MIIHPEMAKEAEQLGLGKLSVPNTNGITYLTKSGVQKVTNGIAETMSKEYGAKFKTYGAVVGLQITQGQLKWIAKSSDFNIDIQSKQSGFNIDYRAVCSKCGAVYNTSYQALNNSSTYQTGSEFHSFCREHRHGVSSVPVEGRKFRYDS